MTVRLENASYRYSPNSPSAAETIDLDLGRARITALIGANGAGKSTLLGLLSGRLKPTSGRALVDISATVSSSTTLPLYEIPPGKRAGLIATLPQSERIAFDLSVLEFVMLARAHARPLFAPPRTEDEDIADAALNEFRIDNLADRAVTELSGGELQLVRLARCLAQGTPFVLLDEPTAMLDPAHELAVSRAIRKMAATGKSICFSTHDLALAEHLADRVLVMKLGRVAGVGRPEDILTPAVLRSVFGVAFVRQSTPRAVAED